MKPPLCPRCDKPVFRDGHMATKQWRDDQDDGLKMELTVCMHCSAIWKFLLGKLVQLSPSELERVWPHVGPHAIQFAINRLRANMPHDFGNA